MSETTSSYVQVSPSNSDSKSFLAPDAISVTGSSVEPTAPSELQYVYYIVYTECGSRPAERPVNSNNPYLARIWIKQVTPPHTVSSLKRCICYVESIPQCACIRGQLFASISSESPMTDGPFPVLASDRPGSKPDDPMAFIVPAVDLTFNSTVKAKNTWSPVQKQFQPYSSEYLAVAEDEILHTDGVMRKERIRAGSAVVTEVYYVLNAKGSLGFILIDNLLPR